MTTPASRREPLRPVVGTTITHQVAFCGPLGVGKTTAVRSASTSAIASTEAPWSVTSTLVGRGSPKRTTTVGIDYGEWALEDGTRVALYGTPGQERFAEARQSALRPGSRIVLWLYGNSPTALADLDEWLELLDADAAQDRLAVAVTRLGDAGALPLERFREAVAERYPGLPVVGADPRDPDDVRDAVRRALRGER